MMGLGNIGRLGRLALIEGVGVDPVRDALEGEDDGLAVIFNATQPRAGVKKNGVITYYELADILDIVVGSQKYVRRRDGTYGVVAAGGVPIEVAEDGQSYLLVEPSKTNLLVRSDALDQAEWTKTNLSNGNTITANTVTAPDGTLSAERVGFGSSGASLRQTGLPVNVGLNTLSAFLRNDTAMNTSLRVAPVGSGSPLDTVCAVVANWKRFLRTFTATGAMSSLQAWLITFTESFNATWLQLEVGNATSPIITTGSTATRAADQISLDLSSGDIRDVTVGAGEYTIYYTFTAQFTPTAAGTVLALSDGTSSEVVALEYSSAAALSARIADGGVDQASIAAGVNATGGIQRQLTLRVKSNDIGLSADGGAEVTDTSATLPAVDRLTFGALFGTTGFTTESVLPASLVIVPRAVA